MILLDTNVISELMRQSPIPSVVTWVNQQQDTPLMISTITIAEITYGLQALPPGKRRTSLESAFDKAISEAFQHQILSFDESAAHFYGKIMGHRKQLGRPMSILDGQIAAIALANGASLATRNVDYFIKLELNIINPFN